MAGTGSEKNKDEMEKFMKKFDKLIVRSDPTE
jgi:hypothetical protein